jgi:hypothetical protein
MGLAWESCLSALCNPSLRHSAVFGRMGLALVSHGQYLQQNCSARGLSRGGLRMGSGPHRSHLGLVSVVQHDSALMIETVKNGSRRCILIFQRRGESLRHSCYPVNVCLAYSIVHRLMHRPAHFLNPLSAKRL